jgi:hypothetical protein
MPRRPRINLAGMPQHIVQRGINREQICAATGIGRAQKRPGRPAGKTDQLIDTELQTDFGF